MINIYDIYEGVFDDDEEMSSRPFNMYIVTDQTINRVVRNCLEGREGFVVDNIPFLKTDKVTNFENLFFHHSPAEIDLHEWDTSNLKNTFCMFWDNDCVESIDLSGWNLRKLKTAENMFQSCGKLKTIDLSGWKLPDNVRLEGMFYGCRSLKTIIMKGCDNETIEMIQSQIDDADNVNPTIITK